jgi:hypothetical protein
MGHPGCRICQSDLEGNWVEVQSAETAAGTWLVTVDVTMQLCAEHKRRLLESVGLPDADDLRPPPRPIGLRLR